MIPLLVIPEYDSSDRQQRSTATFAQVWTGRGLRNPFQLNFETRSPQPGPPHLPAAFKLSWKRGLFW